MPGGEGQWSGTAPQWSCVAHLGLAMEWPSDDGQRQREAWICYGMAWQGKDWQRRGMAKQRNVTQRQATAWQIIEGYAQLRHSSECKAGEERSKASLRSGNELRSNEQKSKKEWIA